MLGTLKLETAERYRRSEKDDTQNLRLNEGSGGITNQT